jgi:GT2 family glycosyltransferase
MLAKTAIIIVNYKTPWHLNKCLESLFKYTENFHLYLVNNSQDKESLEVSDKFKNKYPELMSIYKNNENLGLVEGINVSYNEAINHERICLLNSDVILTKDWLKIMSDEMDNNPSISQIVPDANSYYPDSVFWKVIKLLPFGLSRLQILQLANPQKSPEKRGFKADSNFLAIAGGFCVLFDSKHAKTRGYILDTNLAHGYWDDLDLTLYLRQFGDIGSTNNAYVFHFTNASFKLLGKGFRDSRKEKISDFNGYYIFQKWESYFIENIKKLSPEDLYSYMQDRIMKKFAEYYTLANINQGFKDYVASLPAKKIWDEMR